MLYAGSSIPSAAVTLCSTVQQTERHEIKLLATQKCKFVQNIKLTTTTTNSLITLCGSEVWPLSPASTLLKPHEVKTTGGDSAQLHAQHGLRFSFLICCLTTPSVAQII